MTINSLARLGFYSKFKDDLYMENVFKTKNQILDFQEVELS